MPPPSSAALERLASLVDLATRVVSPLVLIVCMLPGLCSKKPGEMNRDCSHDGCRVTWMIATQGYQRNRGVLPGQTANPRPALAVAAEPRYAPAEVPGGADHVRFLRHLLVGNRRSLLRAPERG